MTLIETSKPKSDLYRNITAKIVAAIESGPCSFRAPWHVPLGQAVLPTNAATHLGYRGINILSLWIAAQERGYAANLWASYRQWQTLGAQVRPAEKGSLIVFYKQMETTSLNSEGNSELGFRAMAKASRVFNVAQVQNYEPEISPPKSTFERCIEAESFVAALKANVQHGFARACYRRDKDTIEMPEREWFVVTDGREPGEAYYAVLLHELTHWSGAARRLDRQFGQRFGDEAYAMEELVAELGAAFLCASFGLSTEPRPDHAAYVSSWVKVLRHDNRALFYAAGKAQKACEYLGYMANGLIALA